MTKPTKSTLIFSLLLILFLSCKNDHHASDAKDGAIHDEQQDREQEGFKEAEQYESADRVIWQKPDLVVHQLGDVEGKVVADLGAGTGYFSRRIAYKGAKVIAIDIDPKAIRWMEEQKARFPIELRDRLVIRKAEPDDPKLERGEVDIVLLVNTYAYINDRVKYFQRLSESLRPGGRMVIIDFKKKNTPFGPPVDERLDVATVTDELTSAGYEIQTVDESSLEYQYIIKVKKGLAQ